MFGLSCWLHLQGAGQESALAEGLPDISRPAASFPGRHHTQLYVAELQLHTAAHSLVAPQPLDLVGGTPSTGTSRAPHSNDNPTEASHTQAAALQTEPGPSRPAAGMASAVIQGTSYGRRSNDAGFCHNYGTFASMMFTGLPLYVGHHGRRLFHSCQLRLLLSVSLQTS